MSEDNPEPEKQSEPEKPNGNAAVIQAIPVPSSPPPDTKVPIQFNQQVNVYQIPQNAWDRLTPVQVMELTKVILDQADATDKRHFEFATEQAKRDDSGKKLSIIVGGIISLTAFGAAGWLAVNGHDTAAITISLPLTTILALIVGNRFLH